MSDQDMFDRVHSNRETVVICTPSSPARPLEPYDAFYMAMEGQQLLDRGQRKIVQQHPFANEPSSPTTKPAALYSEIAKSHPLAQSSSPSLSAPASPRLTWEVWSGCQGSFSNGKFLGNQPSAKDEIASAIDVLSRTPTEGRQALQGTLSDGEILDDSKLAKKEPVSMVELEHDFAFLGSLSDGEFLHLARRTKECPSPRLRSLPSLRRVPGYDAFEFQGTLSDGEFSNSGRRTIDITAIRQTPTLKPETTKRVYISPILEQNGFEGSLSDGEFWNSGRYFGGECGPPREAFSTASGLRGGVSLSSPGDVEIEALSTGEIEATIVQVNEEIVMLNNELTHRYRTRYNASAAEPLTDPVPHLPSIPESLYLGPTNYTVDKTAAAHFAETTVHCSHGSENYGFDDGFMLPPPLFDTLTDSSARQTQEHVERSQSLRGQRSLLIDPDRDTRYDFRTYTSQKSKLEKLTAEVADLKVQLEAAIASSQALPLEDLQAMEQSSGAGPRAQYPSVDIAQALWTRRWSNALDGSDVSGPKEAPNPVLQDAHQDDLATRMGVGEEDDGESVDTLSDTSSIDSNATAASSTTSD